MFYPKPSSSSAHPRLDFVCCKQNPVFSKSLENFCKVIIGGDYISALALNRFNEKRRDLFRRDVLVEVLFLDIINASKSAARIFQLQRTTVAVWIWNVLNSRN